MIFRITLNSPLNYTCESPGLKLSGRQRARLRKIVPWGTVDFDYSSIPTRINGLARLDRATFDAIGYFKWPDRKCALFIDDCGLIWEGSQYWLGELAHKGVTYVAHAELEDADMEDALRHAGKEILRDAAKQNDRDVWALLTHKDVFGPTTVKPAPGGGTSIGGFARF